jgi:DNA-binding LytR/AlgR family response regulator
MPGFLTRQILFTSLKDQCNAGRTWNFDINVNWFKMIKCIIIDDEPLALDLLENSIARVPFLRLVKRCKNPFEALAYLSESPVDLIFLDIQMPGITGLEMLRSIKDPPQVVIVSAYDKFAIEGFNMDVTDYLIKPVSFDRFLKACNKVQTVAEYKQKGIVGQEDNYFFVHVEYKQVKINFDQILFIEAMRDYIRIHLNNLKPVITHMSMKAVEKRLPDRGFQRIHKSYIVNVMKIKTVKKRMVIVEDQEVPFSQNYKDLLIQKAGISSK